MDDKELLMRTAILMEGLVKKVDSVESKIDSINDDQIRNLSEVQAVLKEKVSRMEKFVYGSATIIFVQIIAMIFLWIRQKN